MDKLNIFLALIGLFTLAACSPQPVPIQYGEDACHFCKMNIVDHQHAAEIVSTKGKAFKYDAIECMMHDLKNWPDKDIAFKLITAYDQPAKLIDATQATYLISENLPSPMGANLSGFEQASVAAQTQAEKTGQILDWKALKQQYE